MVRTDAFSSGVIGQSGAYAIKRRPVEQNTGKTESTAVVYDGTVGGLSFCQGKKEESSEEISRKEYVKYLEAFMPGRKIVIADMNGNEGIRDYALANQGGFQVVISQSALERMMKDAGFEKKCLDSLLKAREEQARKLAGLPARGKSLLGCGLVMNEEGEISQWVLSGNAVQPPQATEKKSFQWHTEKEDGSYARFKTEKGTITVEKKKLSYVPAKDLVKIARAVNRQLLKKTISGIQAQIYQLKTGSGDKRVRSVLVKQAQQVLQKARIKDKFLNKEELLSVQQKKAAKKAEFEKSLQLKLLLKRKRENRKVREYGQIRDYYETPEERKLERQLEQWDDCYYGGTAPVYDLSGAFAGGGSQGLAPEGTGGVTLDITV